jgi:hypothetical protein
MYDFIKLAKKSQEGAARRQAAFVPTHLIKEGSLPVCIYHKEHTFPMFGDTMFIDGKGQLYDWTLASAEELTFAGVVSE